MKRQLAILLTWILVPIFAFAQKQSDSIDPFSQQILDACKWGGSSTNGIRIGAETYYSSDSKRLKAEFYLYRETDTNWSRIMYPPEGFRLSMSLKGADGKEVEKTKKGESNTKPVGFMAMVKMKWRSWHSQGGWDFLPVRVPDRIEDPIDLLEYFNVKKSGTNTLTVRANVYKLGYNSLSELVVPPVSIPVVITQSDLDAHRAAKEKTPAK